MVEENTTEKPEFEKKLDDMRAENERMEKNLSELKELKASDALSGKSLGGEQPQEPKEESNSDYVKKVMGGQ